MTFQRAGYVTLGILALSLGLNVYLGLRVVNPQPARRVPQGKFALAKGDKMSDLVGRGLDGKPLTVRLNGSAKPTLVYVMSPECIWCTRNEANFSALVATHRDSFDVVLVSLVEKGLAEYVAKVRPDLEDMPVTVITALADRVRDTMFLHSTPQTILVSTDGVVSGYWPGAYIGTRAQEIEAAFSVKLPGLLPAAVDANLCEDRNGLSYSRGAIAVIDGRKRQCGDGGRWLDPTR